ncbi:sulfotransferase family 2 domain-containing protein [Fredinandcohnia humi]
MMKQLLKIHLHMPKTAGTTFKSILRKNYEPNEIIDLYESFQDHEEVMNRIKSLDVAEVEWLNCHLSFGIHNYVQKPVTYITFLRDPFDRLISEYSFILRNPEHGLHQQVKKMSLLEYQELEVNKNKQSKVIIGKPLSESIDMKDVEKAKEIMRKHFTFVGITEHFTESVFLLKKEFNWYNASYTSMNVSQNKPDRNTISNDCLEAIRENNQIDLALYKYVKDQLDEQISILDKRATRQLNLLLNRYKNS